MCKFEPVEVTSHWLSHSVIQANDLQPERLAVSGPNKNPLRLFLGAIIHGLASRSKACLISQHVAFPYHQPIWYQYCSQVLDRCSVRTVCR